MANTLVPQPVAVRRRKTKLMLALSQIAIGKPTEFERPGVQFYMAEADTLIRAMGKLKPIYNGRPQVWMQVLLNSVPAPYRPEGAMGSMAYQCFGRGILYTMPYIPGRRRTTFRLTAAGLGLLDYYAEKHPRFRPFHAAYVTKEARDQINADCFDLAFAIVPPRIERDIVEQEKQIELIRIAKNKKLQEDLIKQQQLLNQQYAAMQAGLQNTNWRDAQARYNQLAGLSNGSSAIQTMQTMGLTGHRADMVIMDEVSDNGPTNANVLGALLKRFSPWK